MYPENDGRSRGGNGVARGDDGEAQALITGVVGRLVSILKIWRPQESQGKSSCSLQLGFAEEFVQTIPADNKEKTKE